MIPAGRKRQNPALLCGIMAVTALLLLSYINVLTAREAMLPQPPDAPAAMVVASAATD